MSIITDVDSIARSTAFNKILAERGENLHSFCTRTNEDYSSIFKYANRLLKIGPKVARKLEDLLGVTEGTLDAEIAKELVVYIPVIPCVASDNFSINDSNVKELLPKAVINAFGWKSENLAVLVAKDDSMAPTIPDGAKVIIDLSSTMINDNKVYAIKIGNDIYIRRIIKSLANSNIFTLIPDTVTYNGSKNYREIELSETSFEIVGRVIMLKDALM